jgi:hypothetical protein
VPSSESPLALADPAARSYWNRCSWWYYTRKVYADSLPDLAVRFQEARAWDGYATKWDQDHGLKTSFADLCALKGQRQPGLQFI